MYAIVAWIWSIGWFVPMDYLKLFVYFVYRTLMGKKEALAREQRKKKDTPNQHPVYGMVAPNQAATFGSVWPTLPVEAVIEPEPNIEESIHRPSLDQLRRPSEARNRPSFDVGKKRNH